MLAHLTRGKLDIIACKVNNYYTSSFEVVALSINNWLHLRHKECTHDDVLIFCYDTPILNTTNVNSASIVYLNSKKESEHKIIAVESEHPLHVPMETTSRSTVVSCTTVFDTPPHFGAWIRYQKTLGVDLVHINAHVSFFNSSASSDPFFLESLQNGFIKLSVWKEYLKPGASFYHSQALYYQNCLYRYLGVHEFCIACDTDDFFTSTIGKGFYVHNVLKRIFSNPKVGSSSLDWLRYVQPPEGFNPPEHEIKDGNLTRYVDTSMPEQDGPQKYRLTKSVNRLSAMIELGIHQSTMFLSGKFHRSSTPRKVAYMAHIRKEHIHAEI